MPHCPICSKEVERWSKFCPECGTRLPPALSLITSAPSKTPVAPKPESKGERRIPVAKIIIVLAIIAAIVGSIIILNKTREDWLSGWSHRIKITIDHTKIDNDLTGFPVAIILDSSNFDFSKARSDGHDIRFTRSDGTTELYYEREEYDFSSQKAVYWVKIPSVSSSSDTEFYMYYGKSDATDGTYHSPTNVWDSSFRGVWHLKENPTETIYDSTINDVDMASGGSMGPDDEVEGKINGCLDFDGSDDYLYKSYDFGTMTELTGEAWINGNALATDYEYIMGHASTVNYSGEWHSARPTNPMRLSVKMYTSDGLKDFTPEWSADNSTWYYVAFTYDGSYIRIYANGSEIGSTPHTGTLGAIEENMYIARTGRDTAFLFNGKIDEVRISDVGRSAAWIKASYHSGNNTLVSFGGEETA